LLLLFSASLAKVVKTTKEAERMSTANPVTDRPDYLDFTAAAKVLPNRPHPATIWRWARKGVVVRGGAKRIHLQHVRAGGRVLTTREWLETFMRELAEADMEHFQCPAGQGRRVGSSVCGRTSEQRQAAAEAARVRMGL
jgi:hypothetical protein